VYISPPPMRAMWHSYLIILNLITRMIIGEQYRSWSSSLCSFLHSPVTLLVLVPNTFLSRLCFNTASLFFLQRETPSFTPTHNNRQNYIAACFNRCVFERRTGRQKIVDRRVAGIPWAPSVLNFSVSAVPSLTLEHGAISRYTVVVAIRVNGWEEVCVTFETVGFLTSFDLMTAIWNL
jgi:hypothetical protein